MLLPASSPFPFSPNSGVSPTDQHDLGPLNEYANSGYHVELPVRPQQLWDDMPAPHPHSLAPQPLTQADPRRTQASSRSRRRKTTPEADKAEHYILEHLNRPLTDREKAAKRKLYKVINQRKCRAEKKKEAQHRANNGLQQPATNAALQPAPVTLDFGAAMDTINDLPSNTYISIAAPHNEGALDYFVDAPRNGLTSAGMPEHVAAPAAPVWIDLTGYDNAVAPKQSQIHPVTPPWTPEIPAFTYTNPAQQNVPLRLPAGNVTHNFEEIYDATPLPTLEIPAGPDPAPEPSNTPLQPRPGYGAATPDDMTFLGPRSTGMSFADLGLELGLDTTGWWEEMINEDMVLQE